MPASAHVNKTAFQSKADHPRAGTHDTRHTFCSCDLDLDPTTPWYTKLT